MPRPRKIGGPEPKRRSRNGCWPCKGRKVKCGEEKPGCLNCQRQGDTCDYSIRLNWEGRLKAGKKPPTDKPGMQMINFSSTPLLLGTMSPHMTVFESSKSPTTAKPTPASKPSSSASPPATRTDLPRPSPPQNGFIRPASQPTLASRPSESSPQSHGSPDSGSVGSSYSGHESSGPRPSVPGREGSQVEYPGALQRTASRQSASFSYNSPSESNFPSPNTMVSSSSMPPPFPSVNQSPRPDSESSEPSLKRKRMNSMSETAHPEQYQSRQQSQQSQQSSYPSEYDATSYSPPTPGQGSDGRSTPRGPPTPSQTDEQQRWQATPYQIIANRRPDIRRVSVNSLLSGSPEPEEFSRRMSDFNGGLRRRQDSVTEVYGFDRGNPDLDLPRNNDLAAISGGSPQEPDFEFWSTELETSFPAFGFDFQRKETVFAKGGYYAQPVPVKIPKSLEPLPHTLLNNQMNLLYFHHFLNHTARILVPHDCSQNPFKTILPAMAVENKNVMNLLLAYSASHRARLLSQPEPANRIATWVQNVFPSLRHALTDQREQISNANLATAIMLASLEIISPSTFGIDIPWQNHLQLARQILQARGGPQAIRQEDRISYFLIRWFAYLDVLGSLSGRKNDQTLFSGGFWATHHHDSLDDDNDFQIDCVLGFTSRCATILAQIAELARQCDNERIDSNGDLRTNWQPSQQTVKQAHWLRHALEDARTHVYKSCPHRHGGESTSSWEDDWDEAEMGASNSSFHWAGLIHLYRRVLGRPTDDPEVQNAVREIVIALDRVRKGGTAEACLLFPMFTAGCDAIEPDQREKVSVRLDNMEGYGMTQVQKARKLMEKVWETHKPWMVLVQGEFFG